MSGVLRGFPPSCPACIWRGDVLKVRLPATAGQAGENPCVAPAKMSGISHLIYKLKVLSFSSKKSLIYELETT